MPVDRYELLECIVEWEHDHPGQTLTGLDLMMHASGLAGGDGRPWSAVTRAAGALRRLGWIDWIYLRYGGGPAEPLPQLVDENTFQQVSDISVTTAGFAALAARERVSTGSQVNIVNSVVGQLALGNISNVNMSVLLDAAEASLDSVAASVEVKDECRGVIRRMREVAQSVTSTAAADVLSASLRRALGLP